MQGADSAVNCVRLRDAKRKERRKSDGVKAERPIILLLENDQSDVFFFRRALSRLGYDGTVRVVSGVTEARAYLDGTGEFSDRDYHPIPDLIVSDMKLFASTGNEFLDWIRRQDAFRGIPVVMLSGSSLPEERTRSQQLGAQEFFIKTGDIEQMTARVRGVLSHLPGRQTS